ncbi:MAG TPA: hypothetical protein VKF79_01255 [Candidatus Acidoferrum sp.]|nr:hypothetical protein [Candidatus Acidoferrum sp.]
MPYRRSQFVLSALLIAASLLGCQKSADQSASSGSTPDASNPMSQNSTPAQPAPPVPEPPLVVPAGTPITVMLDQRLSSKTASAGQTFLASVQSPVAADGEIAIPKGAHVTGTVNDAKAAGRFKGGASLEITLTSVTIDGHDYPLDTSTDDMTHKGKGKRTAGLVGGGGAGGALIGGLAGGGKGALIGALVGAGAGTAGAGLTGKNDVELSAETPLTFRLHAPLEIPRRHRGDHDTR